MGGCPKVPRQPEKVIEAVKHLILAIANDHPEGVELVALVDGRFETFILNTNAAEALVHSLVHIIASKSGGQQWPTTAMTKQ